MVVAGVHHGEQPGACLQVRGAPRHGLCPRHGWASGMSIHALTNNIDRPTKHSPPPLPKLTSQSCVWKENDSALPV